VTVSALFIRSFFVGLLLCVSIPSALARVRPFILRFWLWLALRLRFAAPGVERTFDYGVPETLGRQAPPSVVSWLGPRPMRVYEGVLGELVGRSIVSSTRRMADIVWSPSLWKASAHREIVNGDITFFFWEIVNGDITFFFFSLSL
jgi:hypothetical protein